MTKIIAHRGARNLWAENSLTGFRNVLDLGAMAVEFDLHLGADNTVLVIHDATLDRTTTGTGPVSALTTASRHDLRLIGPEGEIDEGVPLLSEVLDVLAPAQGLHFMPEFKADENGVYDPALITATVQLLRDRNLGARTTLHSFDIDVVRTLEAVAPEFRRMISVNRDWMAKQGGVEVFFETVNDLVDIVAVHHELFEAEFDRITTVFPLDRLSVWTVNDPEMIGHWLKRGPGFLTTDDPRLAHRMMTQGVTA
ncbi:glycerophosphodiester phosphodiesterase family protein [Sulfitobacter guttiformis]|uniref:Glycerophosphoryl diester phosphodiesterase n=1 Tax=Sulfitobacter guttiformis TaxID=74349 RepID=A0A420DHG5_9RHOB|nr:glycerophosphodiester phosphodiesterase family protein [Sulfitobacter guttiformis]KIN72590.1 Glycerophosphoryl diester phosphodiesterase [Sulfitobacter guttiformis KCTC 32187]RKE93668.1 glycerophosphoryl diester phosphodiesterase [Sulfitobacter guttiformis]